VADEPEGVALITEPPKVEDPYDLGDTELHLRHETEPLVGEGPKAPESTPTEEPLPTEPYRDKNGKLHDPVTGAFLPEPVEPSPPSHPAWLAQQAADLGFDEEDLAQPTATLTKQVNRLLRQRDQLRADQSTQRTLEEGRVKPQPPAAEPADEYEQYKEEVAPQILDLLRKQDAKIKALEALGQRLSSVEQFQEQRKHESRTQWIDRLVADDGREALFGKGPIAQLKPNSPELFRRQAVVDQARRMTGEKAEPKDWIPKIPEAIELLFGAKPTAPPTPAPTASKQKKTGQRITPEQWEAAALQPPSHRNGAAEPKGEQKAIAALDAKMREAGIHPDQHDDAEELETLL
jgi:hypothetical protein